MDIITQLSAMVHGQVNIYMGLFLMFIFFSGGMIGLDGHLKSHNWLHALGFSIFGIIFFLLFASLAILILIAANSAAIELVF